MTVCNCKQCLEHYWAANPPPEKPVARYAVVERISDKGKRRVRWLALTCLDCGEALVSTTPNRLKFDKSDLQWMADEAQLHDDISHAKNNRHQGATE